MLRDFTFIFLLTWILLFLIGNSIFPQILRECSLPKFYQISVDADLELDGSGQNIDSIEFWNSPDSSETYMFVTAKGNSLVEVWKYPFEGNQIASLTNITFQNSPVNGVAVDNITNLLYVSIGNPSSTVSVFSLPDLDFLFNFNKPSVNYNTEPNLALLNLINSTKIIYISADTTVYIHDAESGEFIRTFSPEKGLETIAADSFYQRLYIPDENDRTGVYLYYPDGTPYFQNGSNVFGEKVFNSDAEGIIIHRCPIFDPVDTGQGFIVVSDQRADLTDFEFFDRVSLEHLGTLNIPGVSNTDGIVSYPYPLLDYPLGIFAVINNDQTVVIVGWDKIFNEIFEITNQKESNITLPNYQLFQNYPNPFNPITNIRYRIPEYSFVSLKIYNLLGQEISTIVNEEKYPGEYEVIFVSSKLSSSVYCYVIQAGKFSLTRKMVFIR